jgi:hypothetical protein
MSGLTTSGFTDLGVHGLVHQDDFCDFAGAVRDELLAFPDWREMRQNSAEHVNVLSPQRQNGITTGHLTPERLARLPECSRFCELVRGRTRDLCDLAGVEVTGDAADLTLEVNAMAYGEGAWLAAHTDSLPANNDRLLAWMLYLTHPDDGEWEPEKGGAVRLWDPDGTEVRLRPRFNRFAMFRVYKQSFHEIERVAWATGWDRCRLALSGWIRGTRPRQEKGVRVYLKSPDYLKGRAEAESRLQGALALYRLLLQQREYCGMDTAAAKEALEECEQDYEAHRAAPPGTSFLQRSVGRAGSILVLDERRRVSYLGAAANYSA